MAIWQSSLFTLWMGALINENFTRGNVMTSYSTGTEGWPAPVLIYVFFISIRLSDNREVKGFKEKVALTDVEKVMHQNLSSLLS